jgi:predicted 3-demethylubiquinone-9 3-methyltransferase (glyoxalase superfamily)
MSTIQPFLWFNNQAEEAANFYVSTFKNSKILGVYRYGEGAPQPAGSVMTVSFSLNGMPFIALNGGPHFKFSEAISFLISAETQEEIDNLWEKLTGDGGEPGQCGWLKDKFGVSWQVAPPILAEMLGNKDRAKAGRVMQTMMGMKKIIISELQAAYDAE